LRHAQSRQNVFSQDGARMRWLTAAISHFLHWLAIFGFM
jgi:hypothetical protein